MTYFAHRTVLHYVDPDANSNKFYEIMSIDLGGNGGAVIRRWGRYTGVRDAFAGQRSITRYSTYAAAKQDAQKAHAQKWKKGYQVEADAAVSDMPDYMVRAFIPDAPVTGVPTFTTMEEAEAWLDLHSGVMTA